MLFKCICMVFGLKVRRVRFNVQQTSNHQVPHWIFLLVAEQQWRTLQVPETPYRTYGIYLKLLQPVSDQQIDEEGLIVK